MRVRVAFTVDADDLEGLRERAEEIRKELGASSCDVAVEDLAFTVFGVVKGKPNERWSEQVYAADAEEAEAKALEAEQPRSVAHVTEGHV